MARHRCRATVVSVTLAFSTDGDFARISNVCTALGVPADDWVLFWRWADELPAPKAVDELNSYVDVLIAQRCRTPADDMISRYIDADMTVEEIYAQVAAMVENAVSIRAAHRRS